MVSIVLSDNTKLSVDEDCVRVCGEVQLVAVSEYQYSRLSEEMKGACYAVVGSIFDFNRGKYATLTLI